MSFLFVGNAKTPAYLPFYCSFFCFLSTTITCMGLVVCFLVVLPCFFIITFHVQFPDPSSFRFVLHCPFTTILLFSISFVLSFSLSFCILCTLLFYSPRLFFVAIRAL